MEILVTKNVSRQQVLCNWGWTLKQSSAVHIQALVSADVIPPGSSSKLRLLVINLALPAGRQVQFRADSWSIPQLHKASNVSGNARKRTAIQKPNSIKIFNLTIMLKYECK